MEFNFQQTFDRTTLQGRAEEMRKAAEAAKLVRLRQNVKTRVDQVERTILDEAAVGKSFYLYDPIPYGGLPESMTNEDLVRGFQEKFPDCTVTLAEEWVDVPVRSRGAVPMRILKSGIKIDWS